MFQPESASVVRSLRLRRMREYGNEQGNHPGDEFGNPTLSGPPIALGQPQRADLHTR